MQTLHLLPRIQASDSHCPQGIELFAIPPKIVYTQIKATSDPFNLYISGLSRLPPCILRAFSTPTRQIMPIFFAIARHYLYNLGRVLLSFCPSKQDCLYTSFVRLSVRLSVRLTSFLRSFEGHSKGIRSLQGGRKSGAE